MKKLLKILLTLLIILGLGAFTLYLTGNAHLFKGVRATYLQGETSATITDRQFFEQRRIPAGIHQAWPKAKNYNRQKLSDSLQSVLKSQESIAYLVVKNDSILQEHYWGIGSDTSLTNSFSMAKSITVMLVQMAIEKGYFSNWDERVASYLPGLEGAYRDDLTLRHCAQMTAGLRWDEHYKKAFSITAKAYYGSNVQELMQDEVPVVSPPGESYEYQSGSSQLLGLCLREATGKDLSQLASEWLWKPLGARHDAFWHIDSEGGRELSYCCFNSNARDFARLGQLLLQQGHWQGRQLLDSSFVTMASQPAAVPHYGHGFWLENERWNTPVYYMRGILGQYITVIPERNLVLVRLGHQRMPKKGPHPEDWLIYVEQSLKYFGV